MHIRMSVYTLCVVWAQQCQTVSPPGGAGCGWLNPFRHQRSVNALLEWQPTLGMSSVVKEKTLVSAFSFFEVRSTARKRVLVTELPR